MKRMVEVEDANMMFPCETDIDRMAQLGHEWLTLIGEDPTREGLVKTPDRMAKAWAFLTKGYCETLEEVTNGAVFEAEGSNMVVIKNIEYYSMCEHHLLPFFGTVHIGYVPNKKILGLSKFGRITDMFARRLQVQERLSTQIAEAIWEVLEPQGVGVVIEGQHLCMMMRGVEKQHSSTTSSAMLGNFRDDPKTRDEFLTLIRQSKSF
ncbi:MAG: GTP cyclohydrolase I FolE [Meiothermus sp.]